MCDEVLILYNYYYYLNFRVCLWLTEISGGLNTDRLALIYLSEATSVNLFNGQVSVKSKNVPVHINFKKLSSLVTSSSCFVELSMTSTSKSVNDQDLLYLIDDTVAKVNVEGSHEIESLMSENAVLVLSGNVVSGSAQIEDQSRLIALDFKTDNFFTCHQLDDDSRVFANKVADECCDEHIGYLRKQH